jgi:hypothetical protein
MALVGDGGKKKIEKFGTYLQQFMQKKFPITNTNIQKDWLSSGDGF